MKRMLEKSRIQYLIKRRNDYLTIAASSILINFILAFAVVTMVGSERIVLVPPVIEKPMWLSSKEVSPEYLSSISIMVSDLLLNVTPGNAEFKHKLFLKYVDDQVYGKFKGELSDQALHLMKEHTSTLFYLNNIKINTTNYTVLISGDMQYLTGQELQQAKQVKYKIKFSYISGFLKVKSFEEVNKND